MVRWRHGRQQQSGKTIHRSKPGGVEGGLPDGIADGINYGQVKGKAADSLTDEAAQYFAGAVIEQAVRDWRKARASGFITNKGKVSGEMIQAYYRNSSNYKLPTYFDGPADLETLVSFFHGDGLEVWLRFSGLKVDPDTIVAGLDCIPARKAKIGHLLKDDAMESGNYFVDMQGITL